MNMFRTNWFQHPRFSQAATGGPTIKLGEKGAAIQVLQRALLALGYTMPASTQTSGNLDGVFGAETDTRVRDFQKTSLPNNTPDGKVGPMTLQALDAALAGKPVSAGNGNVWGRAPANVPGSPPEIDMGKSMGGLTAVRQSHDMACWAACLSFWGRYCGGGRPRLSQEDVLEQYGDLAHSSGVRMGGISTGNYQSILNSSPSSKRHPATKDHIWNGFVRNPYDASNLTYDWLANNTSAVGRAVLLGYTINGAAHINVIGYYDFDDTPYVWVMEPWDGRFKLRNIEYYQQSSRSFFCAPM